MTIRLAAGRRLRHRHPHHRRDGGDGNGGACATRHRLERRRLPETRDVLPRDAPHSLPDGEADPDVDRGDRGDGRGADRDHREADANLPDSERLPGAACGRFAAAVRPRPERRFPLRRGRDDDVCGARPAGARLPLLAVAAAARDAGAAAAAADSAGAVRGRPAMVAPAGACRRAAAAGGRAAGRPASRRAAPGGAARPDAGARDAVRGRPCRASCRCAARTRGLFSP